MTCHDYICEGCEGTFHTDRLEEEAEAEYKAADYYIEGEERGVICDDCYHEFMDWYGSLSREEHQLIRKEAR